MVTKEIFKIVFISWLFLFTFTLINFPFLAALSVPIIGPLIFFIDDFYEKFFDFFILPLSFGIIFFLLVFLLSFIFQPFQKIGSKAIWLNLMFWFILLVSFEIYSAHTINQGLKRLELEKNQQAECYHKNSFLHSLSIAGKEFQFNTHAIAVFKKVPYFWSYRDQKFYTVRFSIYKNVSAGKCVKYIDYTFVD